MLAIEYIVPSSIDIRKGNGWQRYSILYTIFGSVILNKPETNIAQFAMVIMRINEIEFMSIITIQVGQCLLPVCSNKDKTQITKELPIHPFF